MLEFFEVALLGLMLMLLISGYFWRFFPNLFWKVMPKDIGTLEETKQEAKQRLNDYYFNKVWRALKAIWFS